jgi:hypothetical protein
MLMDIPYVEKWEHWNGGNNPKICSQWPLHLRVPWRHSKQSTRTFEDLRTSQQWSWAAFSLRISHRAVCWQSTDVSEEYIVPFLRARQQVEQETTAEPGHKKTLKIGGWYVSPKRLWLSTHYKVMHPQNTTLHIVRLLEWGGGSSYLKPSVSTGQQNKGNGGILPCAGRNSNPQPQCSIVTPRRSVWLTWVAQVMGAFTTHVTLAKRRFLGCEARRLFYEPTIRRNLSPTSSVWKESASYEQCC